MLVYAGIDEAGYGPMFGPLCVAGATFILKDHDPAAGAPNMWRLLNRAVCRSPRDKRNRIAINDSKKLKGANDKRRMRLARKGRLRYQAPFLAALRVTSLRGAGRVVSAASLRPG